MRRAAARRTLWRRNLRLRRARAAELRRALEETTELASAADAAAAAAASLKSGSATARGHALAACILLAGLVEDANDAADAVAAVLETATDWAARGALAGGLMALAANAGAGPGFVRATKATAAAATKASGGGDDAAAAAARAACWAACAVCGANRASVYAIAEGDIELRQVYIFSFFSRGNS